MFNRSLFSRESEDWETPSDLFENLDKEFQFTLDPCCTEQTKKCEKHYTKEDDGLTKDWSNEVVFCNPPYGRAIAKWVQKASEEANRGATVVLLIPARTDTRWFHEHIYKKAEIRFLCGRLRFNGHHQPAPFPSMVVVMRKESNHERT